MMENGKRKARRQLTPEERSELTAGLLRFCLKRGAAEHVRYGDPDEEIWKDEERLSQPAAQRVGRNDPCPCGSGRKYKHCCGKNR